MKGEDKIFLLTIINAVRCGGQEMMNFRTNKEAVDRVVNILLEVGAEAFTEELVRLKEVVYEES